MTRGQRLWLLCVTTTSAVVLILCGSTSLANPPAPQITNFRTLDPPSLSNGTFGWSLDSANGKVLVGGFDGYSYIYDIASGHELRRLRGSDTQVNDLFGRAVAMSNDYALVGANQKQAAYVFNVNTGQQIRKFVDPGGGSNFGFGIAVSVSGDTIVVGDTGDDTKGTQAGAAYEFSISTGQLLHTFYPSGAFAILDDFGGGVDIAGNTLVVGAPGANEGGLNSGAAYVYDATSWALLRTLAPNQSGSGFGNEVKIAGNLLMVGQSNLGGHGAAYLFDLNTGQLLHKFTSPNPNNDGEFGDSIAFDGQRALIGDWTEQVAGEYYVGGAYLYDVSTGNLLASLLPQGVQSSFDGFGYSVALSGNYLLGSTINGNGQVHVAQVPEPTALAVVALAVAVFMPFVARQRQRLIGL